MHLRKSIFAIFLLLIASSYTYSQTGEPGPIRSSAAYSEVLLRRTQLQADLEAFLADYTEANPKILRPAAMNLRLSTNRSKRYTASNQRKQAN